MQRYLCVLAIVFGLGFPPKTNAQNGSVVRAGYQLPPIAAAPGQVLTIFVKASRFLQTPLFAGSGT